MSNRSRAAAALVLCFSSGLALAASPNDRPSALLRDSAHALGGDAPGHGFIAASALEAIPAYHPAQILVRFEPFVDRAALAPVLDAAGVQQVVRSIDLVPGLQVLAVAPGTVEETCAALRHVPGVRYAEPDRVRFAHAQSTPYGIPMVNADIAWTNHGDGSGAKVAVLDTGVDTTHPDLPPTVAAQSFVPGLTVEDFNRHGTHCSGTVLGLDNSEGVVGVAPGASLIIGKVLNNGGWGFDSWIADGIDWAVAQGADVISMSLGDDVPNQAAEDACVAAIAAGVLVVASAGNESTSDPRYPASYPGVMSIAALDSSAALASFSNFGPLLSLSAPGVDVQSSTPLVQTRVFFNAVNRNAQNLSGSRGGSLPPTEVVDCGFGIAPADFPAAVSGKIAHIRRGNGTFQLKASNAVAAGAVGVLISNNTGGNATFTGQLNDTLLIPVFGISQNDGNLLQAGGITATMTQVNAGHQYELLSGTSMSCPHVSGGAALLIGLFKSTGRSPALPPASTRWILEQTATDLGAPGRDDTFGHGLMNVKAAADYLSGRVRCRGDLNADAVCDDADFVVFAGLYNELISPGGPWTGGDLNGDGTCDDADFVIFAATYNDLICA
ncbi:MAG TPA: S8 family serine peptidase [Phycisphaerales bacterium]